MEIEAIAAFALPSGSARKEVILPGATATVDEALGRAKIASGLAREVKKAKDKPKAEPKVDTQGEPPAV